MTRPGEPKRLRPALALYGALAAVAYVPLLFTGRGEVGADTKTYLYLDPGRLLSRALSMWDPNVGLGTVTHQTIGYLWPMGPFYWVAQEIGLPDWLAQRVWLGSILFAAGAGVVFLLRQFRWPWLPAAVAAFTYMLTPYTLTLAARISVILLAFSGLPWLIAFTVRAVRGGGWRDPALFALTIATVGGVNATALVFAMVGPLLWFPFAVWGAHEATLRKATGAYLRIGALTLLTSLWWISGLMAQGQYGIDILRYTETAKVVAAASLAPEVLRGLGYWFFYGGDRLGPWIEPGKNYTQRLWLITVTYAIPILALLGAVVSRWKHRAYFVALGLAGVFIAVGAYPWGHPPVTGALWKRLLLSDAGLALRSTPRAVPLSALGLAVLLGAGATAIGAWLPRIAKPLAAGLLVLALLGQPTLFTGGMVASNLERPEQLPAYWVAFAKHLDAGPHDTRVLELPGTDFASYRWGNTVDPITPGLIDRAYVARELIPYGSPPSADLLNALDRRIQENVLDPVALVPVARLLGVGEVAARLDLQYERYRTPRPYVLYPYLGTVPGLDKVFTAGPVGVNRADASAPLEDELALRTEAGVRYPPVAAYTVEKALPILRAASSSGIVVLSGDGEGIVGLAGAGLLSGDELLRYTASLPANEEIPGDAALVVTDSNRKRGRRWSTVRDNVGYTEEAGEQPLVTDLTDNRLPVFPGADDSAYTVAVPLGGVHARATGYGNPISYTPEYRASMAVDGDLTTDWRVGASSDVHGERLQLRFDEPVTTDHVTLLQMVNGFANRHITRLDLVFDDTTTRSIVLDASSLTAPGQVVSFPSRTFSQLDLVIRGDDSGRSVRWNGLSQVGFTEVDVDGRHADEVIRVPTDLLDRTGADSLDHSLTFAFERARSDASESVREDEEKVLARLFSLPTPRQFTVSGTAHVSARAPDTVVDQLLGTYAGIESTSSRRLPGNSDARASAAIDGDPTTWWSPAFDVAGEDWVQYALPAPITFDHLDLQVVADGRHSVPTRIRIEADGVPAATVDVPKIADADPQDSVTGPIRVNFPPVTGSTLRFVVEDVREVTSVEWFSNAAVRMPVGIAELGIPGLDLGPPTPISGDCRDDLVTVDGAPLPVRISPVSLAVLPCDTSTTITLPVGDHLLRAADGRLTGIDIDGLVLQSAAGGAAPDGVQPVGQPGPAPAVHVDGQTRTSYDLTITGATGNPYWLVLGQSWNLGWRATASGKDLGPPQLVDGYANGWLVPASASPVAISIQWTPQRWVTAAEVASLAGVALCLGLVAWPRRRRREAVGDVPAFVGWHAFWVGDGSAPTAATTAVATVAALAAAAAVISPVAGLLTGGAMFLALRVRRARGVVALASPVALALAGLYILARQAHGRPTSAFEWPAEQSAVHQVGWMAVAFLVVTVVADALRRRAAP